MSTHINLPIKTVAITLTSLAAIIGFIFSAAPIIADLQDIYHQKEHIEHVSNMVEEVHQLQVKVHDLEQTQDSLKLQIKVLSHSKSPYDSLWILTHSGWKLYHRNTRWIWSRDPDR